MNSPRSSRGLLPSVSALAAAALWGASGTCGQFLFRSRSLNAEWLVCTRLLSAGALLLLLCFAKFRRETFEIWRSPRDRVEILLFGIFGMLAVQYTYFAAIELSNAATATVLQYLGPMLIAFYYAVKERRLPKSYEAVGVVLATTGTFLLVTHGSFHALAMTPRGLFWGLASAVALAFYSVQPMRLLRTYRPAIVVGWGMWIGGLAFALIHPPWKVAGVWDDKTVFGVGFIVIFGSLIPFYLYLSAIQKLGAKTSSLLACAEPLSAALLAVYWLGVDFQLQDWIGALLIVSTIALLAFQKPAHSSSGS